MTEASADRRAEGAGAVRGDAQHPEEAKPGEQRRKGPLSFLSGSLTSLVLAWLFLQLAQRVVVYYSGHPPHYSSQVAQSIAVAVKTLVVGMGFLATFTCAFVGLGLFLVFLRSLMPSSSPPSSPPS